MRLRRFIILLLAVAVLLGGLFIGQAQAAGADVFAVEGGSPEQNKVVRAALELSTWDWAAFGPAQTRITLTPSHPPYWGDETALWAAGAYDGQLAFPLVVSGTTRGVSYFPSGDIYIDSRITAPTVLAEIAMHEAAHSRVMFVWFWDRPAGASVYECYALDAWRDLIGAYGDMGDWMTNPVESHAEWFRCTYLDSALQADVYPRTSLPGPPGGTADVIAFHNEWCDLVPVDPEPEPEPEPEPPVEPTQPVPVWGDIPRDDTELLAASIWALGQGIWLGYPDGTFGPWAPVLKRHVALVAHRAGLEAPAWEDDYTPATRAEVRDSIPGLIWLEERWAEQLSRSQLLRLMFRGREQTAPDDVIGARLEAWFAETAVTWQGTTRAPRLQGYGQLMVTLARQHDVPLWLALGQCWRESQWGTTGLSIDHNMLWGMKDVLGKWGELRGVISGFADYATLEECIRAYYRLMDQGTYRRLIDTQDWRGLLDYYAPPSENNTEQHYKIVMTIRDRCMERGIW